MLRKLLFILLIILLQSTDMLLACCFSPIPQTVSVNFSPISLSFSPDSANLAVANGNTVTIIQSPSSSPSIINNIMYCSPFSLAYVPDGSYLAVLCSAAQSINMFSAPATQTSPDFSINLSFLPIGQALDFPSNSSCMACLTASELLIFDAPFSASSTPSSSSLQGTLVEPQGLAISPDNSCIAITDFGANLVYVAQTPCNPGIFSTIPDPDSLIHSPGSVTFSPDSQYLAVANVSAGTVSIIRDPCTSSAIISNLNYTFSTPISLAFSPDGHCLAVANQGTNQVVMVTNPTSSNPIFSTLSSDISYPEAVAFSPDGTCLAVANGTTNTVAIFSTLPSITISPTNPAACLGGVIQITATATPATDSFTYSWTGPNGFTATTSTITITNVQSSDAGTYTVTITDTTTGCIASVSTVLNVSSTQAPTFSVLPQNTSVCQRGTAQFSATASSGSDTITYSWSGPNGFSGTGSQIFITNAQAVNAGTYTVTVTDTTTGCINNAFASLIVNTPPTIAFSPPAPATCVGDTLQFSAIPTGASPFTYSWTGPNFTSTLQTVTIANAQPSNSGTYSVTVTDVNGCSATNSVNVVINNNPLFTVPPTDTFVCIGGTAMFTAIATSGIDTITYSWSGPDGFIATGSPITITDAQLINAGMYTVTATDTTTDCSSSASATLTVNTLQVNSQTGCIGSTVSFTAQSTGEVPIQYVWTGPAGFSATGKTITLSDVQSANAGTYTVTAFYSSGCSLTASATLTLSPRPQVIVTASRTTLFKGQSAILTAIPSNGTPPYTLNWSDGLVQENVIGATTRIVQPTSTTSYSLIITDSLGCLYDPGVVATITVKPDSTLAQAIIRKYC